MTLFRKGIRNIIMANRAAKILCPQQTLVPEMALADDNDSESDTHSRRARSPDRRRSDRGRYDFWQLMILLVFLFFESIWKNQYHKFSPQKILVEIASVLGEDVVVRRPTTDPLIVITISEARSIGPAVSDALIKRKNFYRMCTNFENFEKFPLCCC